MGECCLYGEEGLACCYVEGYYSRTSRTQRGYSPLVLYFRPCCTTLWICVVYTGRRAWPGVMWRDATRGHREDTHLSSDTHVLVWAFVLLHRSLPHDTRINTHESLCSRMLGSTPQQLLCSLFCKYDPSYIVQVQ